MDPTVADGGRPSCQQGGLSLPEPQADDVVVFSPEGAVDGAPNIKGGRRARRYRRDIRRKPLCERRALFGCGGYGENGVRLGKSRNRDYLGEDEYFVLGDNRNNSEDSRYQSVGNVTADEIEGKVWLKVSLSDFGLVR